MSRSLNSKIKTELQPFAEAYAELVEMGDTPTSAALMMTNSRSSWTAPSRPRPQTAGGPRTSPLDS